jgi:TolB protein
VNPTRIVILALAVLPAGAAEAAWPGADGKIAFESDRAGNAEIFVMNADGSEQTNLTNHPAADRIPSWSPDGTKIAFQSNRDGDFDIYVMNADGTGVTQITNDPAQDANAWWSPNGKRIVFSSSRDHNCPPGTPELRCFEIYVMKADGTHQRRLTFDPGNDGAPAWSPDGDRIAFGRRDNTTFKWDVWVMNPAGHAQTRLTDEPANNPEASRHPDWTPDGEQIAFESTRDAPPGNIELYVMRPDGSAQTRLTTTAAPDLHAAWSPNAGERIAFTSRRDGNAEICVMNADGSGATRLTFAAGLDNFPDWQPLPTEAD